MLLLRRACAVVIVVCAAAITTGWLGTPIASAVPADPPPSASTAPSAPAAPSAGASPSAGVDPSGSPGADGASGDDPDGIKSGTPQMGKLHWEKFGGGDEGAAKNMDEFSNQLIGYALTIFGIAAVVAGLTVTMLMIGGVRGRSALAKTALESSIWIWLACLIVGSFSTLGGIVVFAAIPS